LLLRHVLQRTPRKYEELKQAVEGLRAAEDHPLVKAVYEQRINHLSRDLTPATPDPNPTRSVSRRKLYSAILIANVPPVVGLLGALGVGEASWLSVTLWILVWMLLNGLTLSTHAFGRVNNNMLEIRSTVDRATGLLERAAGQNEQLLEANEKAVKQNEKAVKQNKALVDDNKRLVEKIRKLRQLKNQADGLAAGLLIAQHLPGSVAPKSSDTSRKLPFILRQLLDKTVEPANADSDSFRADDAKAKPTDESESAPESKD
jgi:hypothetical protein